MIGAVAKLRIIISVMGQVWEMEVRTGLRTPMVIQCILDQAKACPCRPQDSRMHTDKVRPLLANRRLRAIRLIRGEFVIPHFPRRRATYTQEGALISSLLARFLADIVHTLLQHIRLRGTPLPSQYLRYKQWTLLIHSWKLARTPAPQYYHCV